MYRLLTNNRRENKKPNVNKYESREQLYQNNSIMYTYTNVISENYMFTSVYAELGANAFV